MSTYLFDFDGTLVDSMPYYVRAMLKILDEHGISYSDDIIRTITPLGTMGTAQYFADLGVDLTIEEIIHRMGEYAVEAYWYHIPAKEYVIDALRTLKARGDSLNVLTASPHITLDKCLERLGMWDLFDNVWSCDDFGTTKADPQIYRDAAERMGSSVSEVLFFDDNLGACTTAKDAGMTVCGVYDSSSKDDEGKIRDIADYYIKDFSEILELEW